MLNATKFNENWQKLRYPICELWKTFVKRVRFKCRDNYYDFKTVSGIWFLKINNKCYLF